LTAPARTVADALRAATARLEAAGKDGARLDAEVLLAAVLACDRVRLITARDRRLDPDEEARLDALLERRASGEPVAYLLGEREFWSLPFAVGADVLIPRPETEGVVEACLDAIARCRSARAASDPVRVVDVGTGSGAIAIALACEARRRGWSNVWFAALDRSRAALRAARANARNLTERDDAIAFLHGDLTSALRAASIDVVASNPPYLSDDNLRAISTEVAREPVAALRGGGKDGTQILRGLLTDAVRVLRPGGVLVTEIGSSQGRTVQALAHDLGFADIRVLPDLAGLDRVVSARWQGVGTQA
jgi:release factor glutamine methyltransferase